MRLWVFAYLLPFGLFLSYSDSFVRQRTSATRRNFAERTSFYYINKAVNFDGTEITQLDIEPYKQFKLIIEAVDPDNNRLEYKFDSASGTFAGISSNSNGCTAVFKTGSIKGGQNIELWAMVTDGKGALVRQSFNLGTGKTGPAIVASLEKIRFRPTDKIKLSVSANCSGFFQLYCDGPANFDFEKDMYRYSYGSNKTTDFILAGPNCTSYADMVLEAKLVV